MRLANNNTTNNNNDTNNNSSHNNEEISNSNKYRIMMNIKLIIKLDYGAGSLRELAG